MTNKKVINFFITLITVGTIILINEKSCYAMTYKTTYENMIISGINTLLNKNFDEAEDYIIYAYENNLISEEDFYLIKYNKVPTKQTAASFLKNLLNTNINYVNNPFEDESSLALNNLFYNLIIDPTDIINAKQEISFLTWSRWLNNASDYIYDELNFIQTQTNRYNSVKNRILDFGYVELEDSIDIQIYNAFYHGINLNAYGLVFSLEENKETLEAINFKSKLQEDWLIFNRTHGELTSGTKIEVRIEYLKNETKVNVNFIYPENYLKNKLATLNFVDTIIEKENIKSYDSETQIRKVADFIIDYVSYPDELQEEYKYAYGATKGIAVCSGYTDLFSLFMKKIKIPNIRIQGTYEEIAHTWNLIELNSEHYFVDTTLGELYPELILTDELLLHIWDKNSFEKIIQQI